MDIKEFINQKVTTWDLVNRVVFLQKCSYCTFYILSEKKYIVKEKAQGLVGFIFFFVLWFFGFSSKLSVATFELPELN